MLNNSTILITGEDSFIGFQAAEASVRKVFKVYTHQSLDRARKTSPNLFKYT